MSDYSRLVFPKSPFLPVFDHEVVTSDIALSVSLGHDPAAAIAYAISRFMENHAVQLLLADSPILQEYRVSRANLRQMTLGYEYPTATILVSTACQSTPTGERRAYFEKMLVDPNSVNLLLLQDQIGQDLNSTINLLKLDPSGALVFALLQKYPFASDEYFLAGMEIAAIIFFGLAQEVVKVTGDDSWLTKPIDPPQFVIRH